MSTEAEGRGLQQGSELRRSVSAAAERIEEILVEAEHAADQIRDDAVAEAERYLAQRRGEADRFVDEQLGRLQTELDRFRANLAQAEPVEEPVAPEVEQPPAQASPPGVVAYAGRSATEAAPVEDRHDKALIRATQLAVQGTERSEIVETLRREFARADSEAIVAEILD